MWYDFNFGDLYKDGLGEVEFTDMRTGEEIDRDYSYVYWGDKERDIYGRGECSFNVNGTQTCENVVIGTETYQDWIPYDSKDIPKGKVRIGIRVNVEINDYVDGVWTIIGKKVSRHADWIEALNTGLIQYFNFSESSGAIVDATGQTNGINSGGVYSATGIIGDAHQFDTNTDYVNTTLKFPATDDFTANIWFNSTTASLERLMTQDATNAGVNRLTLQADNTSLLFFIQGVIDSEVSATVSLKDGAFHMITVRRDGINFSLFVDGDFKNSSTDAGSITQTQNLHIGSTNGIQEGFIGNLDEWGFWNLSLTNSQITDNLWNGGSGNTWTDVFAPIITLNSPIDTFNTTNSTIFFNGTVSSGVTLLNVSLIIDGLFNETNSSGIEGDYLFTKTILDGNHNWTYEACDDLGCINATTRTFTIDSAPVIVVVSPTNTTFTTSTIFFNATNTLTVDKWIVNYNGTNTTFSDINTSLEVEDGAHHLLLYANNSVSGVFGLNDTIFFSVDTTEPFLNLTSPSGLLDFGILTVNETLNWNVSDINLDTCFYDYNFTNTTVTCANNITTFALTSQRNLTFYANDTLGNLASNFTTWNYKIFENNQTFTSPVTEGSLETFSINYDVDSGMTVTIANLSYNDTQNIDSITDNGGGNFVANKLIVIPSVTADTNITFFWNFTFSDGSFVSSASNNQTIKDLNISDCSVNTNLLFNFTLVDEEFQNKLSGSGKNTSIEVDIDLSAFGTTTPIIEFSKFYNQTNPAEVCLNLPLPSTTKYRLDSTIRYKADPYSVEHYNIQNFTLENTTMGQNITLFDLLIADTTEFRITFKDSSFIPVENALIQI
ncbi:MAG: LamG-like jellyroll fold domain-containing protein, partial [Nitrosopumilus sp.]